MALYKYFKKAPSALRNPSGFFSYRMPSEAISSPNHEMSEFACQGTGKNSKTMNATRGRYATFSGRKLSVIPQSQVNPFPEAG